jgi:hypothetical protein
MLLAVFEPTIPARERPHTYSLDRAAPGIGLNLPYRRKFQVIDVTYFTAICIDITECVVSSSNARELHLAVPGSILGWGPDHRHWDCSLRGASWGRNG